MALPLGTPRGTAHSEDNFFHDTMLSAMIWRIEIKEKPGMTGPAGLGLLRDIVDLGITSLSRIDVSRFYRLRRLYQKNKSSPSPRGFWRTR